MSIADLNNNLTLILNAIGVLSAVSGIIYSAYKVGTISEYIKSRFEKVDADINSLREFTSKDIDGLKKDVSKLYDCLLEFAVKGQLNETYLKRNSPIQITEKGQQLFKKSRAKEYIDTQFEDMLKSILAEYPEHNYSLQDIEDSCIRIFAKKYFDSSKDIISIKNYFYKEGVDNSTAVYIMAIYLRDKVIANLNLSEDANKQKS